MFRVNGLNIGWMNTPGEESIQKSSHGAPDNWLEKASKAQPFGRLLGTREVAAVIAFLCSDESGMMTGSIVDCDQSVLGSYEAPPAPRGTAHRLNRRSSAMGHRFSIEDIGPH